MHLSAKVLVMLVSENTIINKMLLNFMFIPALSFQVIEP